MTKKERLKHYKNALQMLTEGTAPFEITDYNAYLYDSPNTWLKEGSGICELLSLSITEGLDIMGRYEESFPEFYLFYPKEDRNFPFWWAKNNRKARILALEFCIAMLS